MLSFYRCFQEGNIVCPSSILSMPSPKSSIVKCSFITAFKISIGLKSAPIHRKVKKYFGYRHNFFIFVSCFMSISLQDFF